MSLHALQARYPHLNLRWNMAQMDRFRARAEHGASAEELAFEFDTTTTEVERLAHRNGIFVRRQSALRHLR